MPKIGDALKRAVEERPGNTQPDIKRARQSSVLMNLNRRRVFQYLCRNPCSKLGRVARGTSLSRSSARWHLEVLADSGYIHSFLSNNRCHYCPRGLIAGENLELFAILATENNAAVYGAILRNPGSDVGALESCLELSRKLIRDCLGRMLDAGLVTAVADGRYVRYFPTEKLADAVARGKAARKAFITQLLRRLSAEHLKPELKSLKGPETVITVCILGRNDELVVPQLFLTKI